MQMATQLRLEMKIMCRSARYKGCLEAQADGKEATEAKASEQQ